MSNEKKMSIIIYALFALIGLMLSVHSALSIVDSAGDASNPLMGMKCFALFSGGLGFGVNFMALYITINGIHK